MFVSNTDKHSVTLDNENIIFIRVKMNVEVRSKVISAALINGERDAGKYMTALLIHNIVGWSGPRFDGIECTPPNILALDSTEPLVDEVLNEINKRNKRVDQKK